MRDFHAPRKKPWNGWCCLKALFRKPMSRRSCPELDFAASAWSGKSLPSPDLQTLTRTLPAARTCKGHSPGLRTTPLKLPTAPQLPCAGVELPLCSLKALPEAAAPVFPPSEHVAGVCCLAASHRVVVARRGRRAAGCQLHPVVSLRKRRSSKTQCYRSLKPMPSRNLRPASYPFPAVRNQIMSNLLSGACRTLNQEFVPDLGQGGHEGSQQPRPTEFQALKD